MKLPDNFEKDYFALLVPVSTDGTLKNRRNLLVASFTISLLYLLGKPLTGIRFLGIKLDGADGKILLSSALILILFWCFMFCVHAIKDFQINKERRYLLIKHTEKLKSLLDDSIEKYEHLDNAHPNKLAIPKFKREYEIFLDQKKRTRSASLLATASSMIEHSLPILFAFWCFYLLSVDIYRVW